MKDYSQQFEDEGRAEMFEQQKKRLKQANPACRDSKGRDRCPHCGSYNVEYSNYEWSCLDCGEQWDQYGQDTK